MVILAAALARPHAVRASSIQLSNDNERILQSILNDGSVISDAIIAYQTGDGWMLPFIEFSQALGFAIDGSPTLGGAEGFIFEESRRFHLSLSTCEVRVDGKVHEFRNQEGGCKGALIWNNDIFVESSLIQQWFPILLSIDPFKARVEVNSREKLPVQLKRERDGAAGTRWKNAKTEVNYPLLQQADSAFAGPFLDQQLSIFGQGGGTREQSNLVTSDTALSADLLGWSLQGFASATNRNLNHSHLGLSRKDPDGKLLGPLGATEVEILDYTLEQLPLVSLPRTTRGFHISNYPLNHSEEYGFKDFEGTILPGWDIELYRNSVLIDRQTADNSGRYRFERVPLLYGNNQFRLAFYGPQGQRREEYKTVRIEPNAVKAGERKYRMALGMESSPRYVAILEQNIGGPAAASLGVTQVPLQNGIQERYGYLGIGGFTDNLVLKGSFVAAEHGGKAAQIRSQMPWHMASLGLRYTRLFDFSSEVYNATEGLRQDEELQADLGLVIPLRPTIGSTWELIRKRFEDGSSQLTARNRLSFSTGPIFWNTELSYQPASSRMARDLNGKIEGLFSLYSQRLRMGITYSRDAIHLIEAENQTKYRQYAGTLGFRRLLALNQNEFSLNVSREFQNMNIGASATVNAATGYMVGALVSFSLARENGGDWHMRNQDQSTYGAATVQAFRDTNRNGEMDDSEPPLSGVAISVNQRDGHYVTGDDGSIFIPRLQPYVPTDLLVVVGSLQDPMLRLAEPGYRFFPRPGKATRVLMPVVSFGEIDGRVFIQDGKHERPYPGLPVHLIDRDGTVVAIRKTDRDGVFYFEDVSPGDYEITPSFTQAREHGLQSIPLLRRISIPSEGGVESGLEFTLAK